MILAPSLLSSDFSRLGEELTALEAAGLGWVHWDVMDGMFVPNITFGAPVIKALRPVTSLFFDVHLMIESPERYINDFAEAGANMLVIHAEASRHLQRTLSEIKRYGMQCGVALNPSTPLCTIEEVIPLLDMVLIMSVNPGFGGQGFIPQSRDKIRRLKGMLKNADSKAIIQVDGGVEPTIVKDLVADGADVLVSGSAFFKFPPYRERYQVFNNALL